MRAVDGAPQRAQDRRMARVVQIGDRLVVAIDGDRVLDQVVGADRKELHLRRQQVDQRDRRRGLDDDAEVDFGRDQVAFGLENAAQIGEVRAHRNDLLDAGDQREQDPQPPRRARPQQRPQLHRVEIRAAARETHAAKPEGWIRLRPARAGDRQLVTAEVDGPDRRGMRRRACEHGAVVAQLFVFAGRFLPVQVQELGAEQADARGAMAAQSLDLVGALEVGAQRHLPAVAGLGRQIGEAQQRAGPLSRARGAFGLFAHDVPIRPHPDPPRAAVDDDEIALSNRRRDRAEPDDRRQTERMRKDHRVRRGSSGIGGEADDVAAIQLRDLGRRQIAGDQNGRLAEGPDPRRLAAQQAQQQLADREFDVGASLAQIGIGDRIEDREQPRRLLVQRALRVDALVPDPARDVVEQLAILEDHQLGLEDGIDQLDSCQGTVDRFEPCPRGARGAQQPRDLGGRVAGRQPSLRDHQPLGHEHTRAAGCDPGRCRDPVENRGNPLDSHRRADLAGNERFRPLRTPVPPALAPARSLLR